MARPPLALGCHGTIKVTRDGAQWVARCRVRDLDGVTRRVCRWGPSKTAAQQALQDELRTRRGDRAELLRPNSRFRDAGVIYLAKIETRREDSTAGTYRYWLEKLLVPQLGGLRLAECDVAEMDAFFAESNRTGGSSSIATARRPRSRCTQRTPDARTARSFGRRHRSPPARSTAATAASPPALSRSDPHPPTCRSRTSTRSG